MNYADLPKKNFLYKVSGLSRGVAAILIPKDRPKPVSVAGIGGLRMIENYFSESEDRHIMRFDGTRGSGPATARVTYAGGSTESFNIKNLSGRTDYAPGPWKGAASGPVTPPGPPPSIKPPAASITFPAKWVQYIQAVYIVEGVNDKCQAKSAHLCAKVNGNSYGTGRNLATYAQPAFYAVDVVDSIEALIPHSVRGWVYVNGKGEIVQFGAQPIPPVTPPPVVPPVDPPKPPTPPPPPAPPSNKDVELTATGIRLASDLAQLVAKVIIIEDAHTNRTNPPKHLCTFMGNGQWGTGKPLSAYRAAVFQIFWNKEPRIPHHQGFPGAIKNVSHVTQAGAWNPPSTRNP